MKKRTFLQNKLWRDKAVHLMEELGSLVHWQRLDDSTYDQQLRLKLIEESHEVCKADSPQELMEELADIFEVIDAICEAHAFSLDQVRTIQLKKRTERGGFKERKFVTKAEHLEGSFGEKYCLANLDKYPEMKDT